MPVLRRRAAAWCLDNGMPEAAHWTISWQQGTSMRPPAWQGGSCRPFTGMAGWSPSSSGLGGWRTGAGSRDIR